MWMGWNVGVTLFIKTGKFGSPVKFAPIYGYQVSLFSRSQQK